MLTIATKHTTLQALYLPGIILIIEPLPQFQHVEKPKPDRPVVLIYGCKAVMGH